MLVVAPSLLPAVVLPTDRRVVLVGRFARGEEGVVSCQWPASEVRLRVKGGSLSATIEEKGADVWAVMVDGVFGPVLAPKEGVDSYTVPLGGEVVHEVRLIKRTEPFVGTTSFRAFEAPGGSIEAAKEKKRHLEFVGDSITCGFGNEGANQNEKFSPKTENAAMSYASITGRQLDADVALIAWSGRKMWPDNTMPEIYDLVLPVAKGPVYDFKGPKPDAVVINLATNDFGVQNPEEKGWTAAYEAFIRRVWGHYPKAQIYVTTGSMMTDSYPAGHNALSTVKSYLAGMMARMNDPRVHFVDLGTQQMEDGIGAAWHPNLKTDQKMADRLTEAIRRDLKW